LFPLAAVLVLGLAPAAAGPAVAPAPPDPAPPAASTASAPDYERDVVPILRDHCVNCHSTSDPQGDLVLETHEELVRGGENGPVLTAGNSLKSKLVLLVEGKAKPKMPPKQDLPPDAIAVLKAWIDAGAEPSATAAAAALPVIKPRRGRPAPVHSVAWSQDGRILAIGGYQEARLLDAASGQVTRTLDGASDAVRALAFSPDGKLLVGAGGPPARGGEAVVWDLATGERLRTLTGQRDAVGAAAFSPNGRFLATASYDRSIRVWYAANGRERARLREHLDAVFALAFSPDGKWLASASGDRTVKMWDVAEGRRVFTLSDALDTVYAVAFHPSGKQLAAAGADRNLRVWDLAAEGGTLAFSAIAHEDAILRLAYTPDGRSLVTAAADGTVKVWDADRRVERRALPRQPDWPSALSVDAAGARVAVGRYDGTVGVYDLESGRLETELPRAAPRARVAGGAR
jgi:WD40 repeat protein